MSTPDSTHPPSAPPQAAAERLQVACFCVGEQTYALDIMRVKEIVNPVPIAPVPNPPPLVEGVIELRGAFLAVLDVRKRLASAPAPLTRDSKYMVVTIDGQRVALIVDRVIDVRRVERADIASVPALARAPEARFVAGVARWDEGIVLILDLDQLLSGSETQGLRDLAG